MDKSTHPKVLVADDDRRIRESLSEILKLKGYAVSQAENGDEVLEAIQKCSPDVILLDINMPGKSGLQITKLLKSHQEWRHIPIVIVTGQDDMQSRIEALKLGADDFLMKPPHVSELSARVKSLVKVKAYNDHMRDHQKLLERKVAERTEQLKEALEEIKHTSLDTIYRLSRAAEYRDEDTAAHLQRMSNYASALGRTIGLNEQEVEHLLYASPMHDIGKIGIPDRVLLKPGKLDKEEWELMKTHTLIGEKILEGSHSKYLNLGLIICKTHHERWDGSGYPLGLDSGNIPIEGRITAVADVFDAVTTNRPYKEALSVEQAFSILEDGRGIHFDPELIDAFFSIRDEILEIKNKFGETKVDVELMSGTTG